MAHDVFISHSAKDKAIADAMCAHLESSGIRCWVAPRDVLPGMKWAQAIFAAIQASRAFVLIFSTASNRSQQVLNEVDLAVKTEIPLVPFRIDDTALSDELKYYVGRSHWLDAYTAPLDAHLHRLRDTLRSLLGAPAAPVAVATPPPAPPPPPLTVPPAPRRARVVALLAVGVLVVGVGAYLAFRGDGGPSRPPSGLGPSAAPAPPSSGPPPAPLEAWRASLDLANSAAAAKDWETASQRLAEAKSRGAPAVAIPATLTDGVSAYEADPVLAVSEPVDGAAVAAGPLHVRGRLRTGRATDRVEVNGAEAPLRGGGFDATVVAPEEGSLEVVVRVVDRGAERGVPVRLSVRVPPREAWRGVLDAAIAASGTGDWEAASKALAQAKSRGAPAVALPATLTEGVAAYDADPVLEVSEPVDGATVPPGPLRVRGRLRTGRRTDRVDVNGAPAALREGAFDATVAAGTLEVVVRVVDRGTPRGAPVHRTVNVRAAPEPWRAFLAGWAEPVGSEVDRATGYPRRVRRTTDGMEMVLIPAGTFQMGAVPGDALAASDEKPRHAVTLSKAYYADVSEVTVGMWKKYAAARGLSMPTLRREATDAHPMHEVSWDDVQGYVAWAGVALPTEAQWERAAKGGHDDYVYPWGSRDDVRKRNGDGKDDGFDGLAPVKTYAANDFGLHDMSGNVWEWCADGYDANYYGSSPPRDPTGPSASASSRVLRGGSWFIGAFLLRASLRDDDSPSFHYGIIGFRCARSLP